MENEISTMAMAESDAQNQIVVYQPNETVRLDVRLENETVWLTQAQLCELFGVVKSNVSYHLKNIFTTNELDYGATVQKIRTVRLEAGRNVSRDIEYFNLDVIISLGYRINSKLGIQFRQWATRVLKNYLLQGYAVNAQLSQLEDKVDRRLAKHGDRIATLEEKVDFFVQTQTPPLQGRVLQRSVLGRAGVGAETDPEREAVADPHRQLGEHGGARPLCEEAQGRETDHFHIGAFQEGRAEAFDFACRRQDLQRAVPETRRALQRNLPRPLPHH